MRADCYFYPIKILQYLIGIFNSQNALTEDFIFPTHELMGNSRDVTNPTLATNIHRLAKKELKTDDLYANEKANSNSVLLKDYTYWSNYIDTCLNPFYTVVKLAIAGNVINYGAHRLNGKLKEKIVGLIAKPLKINMTEKLGYTIKK